MLSYQADQIVDALTEIRDELRRANEIQTAIHAPVRVAFGGGVPDENISLGWQPSWEQPPHFNMPTITGYGR